MTRDARLRWAGVLGTAALVLPLAWLWHASLVPDSYSVMDMGYLDYGGGSAARGSMAGMASMADMVGGDGRDGTEGQTSAPGAPLPGHSVSVADLTADPDRPADVVFDLVARQQVLTLASGRRVDGYTVNGGSPGPTLRVTVGDLVEVHVHNRDVAEGMTIHWHGVDLPNAEDGVAGVTQDAIPPGESFTYRFVAPHVGTYWYHSHQVSHVQVIQGLFGVLVVLPRAPVAQEVDVVGVAHVYDGVRTLNGREGDVPVVAEPGDRVRLRLVNTDNGPMQVWADAPWRLVAHDGYDLNRPDEVPGRPLTVTAAGRDDLEVRVPRTGAVRVQVGASTAFVVGPSGAHAPSVTQPTEELDLRDYGAPAPVGFDATHPDRSFEYSIGRRPGFVDGRPGVWWSVNGHLFPDMPMFVVAQGDVVRIHLDNHSGDVHPMHLHGHHAVVLSFDGEPVIGSPWWFDTLNLENGESADIAFLADNPGVWMDHCHNLNHAAQGLVTHLMYEGVREPFRVGGAVGNEPE